MDKRRKKGEREKRCRLKMKDSPAPFHQFINNLSFSCAIKKDRGESENDKHKPDM